MRYSAEHKARTRTRIITSASRGFREEGLENHTVVAVMSALGLTTGGFFHHFESKEELAAEAVRHAMDERRERLDAHTREGRGIEDIIRTYFSTAHRDRPGGGCPTAAMAADIARHSPRVRRAYADGLDALLGTLADQWPDMPRADAVSRATALYGMMSGCLMMSRATGDRRQASAILEAGLAGALHFAGVRD
ncbi:TetR/AcrR family transcriptional regulator [Luteibacter pinisoli]|uniref:TetR/AcrR family transcriptional regulator n=1 Tax=Luteibacter pinisoli TaxID=2589080 RepID=A0A4Y5Z3Y3_9GAMM|nr:TetR/AcrR family transcriptional regulator [Luteibacter pinisoli]QDE39857.1 TetR/AcrR family transcriptional regulator [Luteibacter pinisoli]